MKYFDVNLQDIKSHNSCGQFIFHRLLYVLSGIPSVVALVLNFPKVIVIFALLIPSYLLLKFNEQLLE